METERFPFSDDQNQIEQELSLSEALTVLLEKEVHALKQVEIVSAQLFQALERQMKEVETLITRIKQHRNIPKSMKKSYKEQYWWSFIVGDIKVYKGQYEGYRMWLESVQEAYSEKLSALKQLREDVDTLYPQ